MVSFKVGGVPDLVRPGVTGYLATSEDTDDFCNGIVELFEYESLRKRMSQNCRAITLAEYTLKLQSTAIHQTIPSGSRETEYPIGRAPLARNERYS